MPKGLRIISAIIKDEHIDESESLEYCLQVMAEGTIAEDARICVEVLEAKVECLECGFDRKYVSSI